jgi:hypothetical protein
MSVLCVCVCVCMCVYEYECVYVCVCMSVCLYVYMCVLVRNCVICISQLVPAVHSSYGQTPPPSAAPSH